jgi:hypothetical protein
MTTAASGCRATTLAHLISVKRANSDEGSNRPIDLIEQGPDLQTVITIMVGQHQCDDPTIVGVG